MRKRGVPSLPYSRQEVFKRDSGACHLCGRAVDPGSRWHVDHVLPLWLYGTIPGVCDTLANVAVSHQRCNNRKGSAYYILYAFIDLKAHFHVEGESANPELLEQILRPLSELERARILETWRLPIPRLDTSHAVFALPKVRKVRRKFSLQLNLRISHNSF
ncbi:HNH endonuclease [Micromonospora sp. CA-269861]|uniref:HNH endonuclease n=1 Tax=Micromonospora sp. CA-269861 TaxID=3239968 RepID=UPI003D8B5E25